MYKKSLIGFVTLTILALILTACAPTATPTVVAATINNGSTATPSDATVTPLAPGSVQINGAGATFPLPVYSEWTYAYQYVDPAVVINYQGIGSGGGKKGIIDNTIDFAGSDSLLSDEEYTSGKDLQMYPMLAGAVVVVYNVQWSKEFPADFKVVNLVLDRQTLVDIYNSAITKWNDPRIAALNPTMAEYLPDATITVVHRSDGSGTTEIFTKALSSFSTDWTAGGASSVEWSVDKAGNGIGGKGNQGVAAAVINTPNSLGYVELSYALSNSMKFFNLINIAGNTITANSESVASAMSDFANAFTDKFTATIVNAPGAQSYPIVGYTYIILHTKSMTDCLKAQKLVEYLKWTLTDKGTADTAAKLGYSVLPAAVRDQAIQKFSEITCNGNPISR